MLSILPAPTEEAGPMIFPAPQRGNNSRHTVSAKGGLPQVRSHCRAWVLCQGNRDPQCCRCDRSPARGTWRDCRRARAMEGGHWMDVGGVLGGIKRRIRTMAWRSMRLEKSRNDKLCLDPWSSEWLKGEMTESTNDPSELGRGSKEKRAQGSKFQHSYLLTLGTRSQQSQPVNKPAPKSKWLPGWTWMHWFGRKIQLDWLACIILIAVNPFGQTELDSTLKVCHVLSLCIPKYSYILGK